MGIQYAFHGPDQLPISWNSLQECCVPKYCSQYTTSTPTQWLGCDASGSRNSCKAWTSALVTCSLRVLAGSLQPPAWTSRFGLCSASAADLMNLTYPWPFPCRDGDASQTATNGGQGTMSACCRAPSHSSFPPHHVSRKYCVCSSKADKGDPRPSTPISKPLTLNLKP